MKDKDQVDREMLSALSKEEIIEGLLEFRQQLDATITAVEASLTAERKEHADLVTALEQQLADYEKEIISLEKELRYSRMDSPDF